MFIVPALGKGTLGTVLGVSQRGDGQEEAVQGQGVAWGCRTGTVVLYLGLTPGHSGSHIVLHGVAHWATGFHCPVLLGVGVLLGLGS